MKSSLLLLIPLAACTPASEGPGPTAPEAAGRQAVPVEPLIAQAVAGVEEQTGPAAGPLEPESATEAEGTLRDLVPAAATVWIECPSMELARAVGERADGSPLATACEDLLERLELVGGRRRTVRQDQPSGLAIVHRGPDRAAQWCPVVPVQAPAQVLEGLRVAPGQQPPTAAGTWITLPGTPALARSAAWLTTLPEADVTARLRLARLRALGLDPMAVLQDLCGPFGSAWLAFPGLTEELDDAEQLDLLVDLGPDGLRVELRFDGTSSSGVTPSSAKPPLEHLTPEHGLAIAGHLSGSEDPLAACAASWIPAVGSALNETMHAPAGFACGVEGTPGAGHLVLGAAGDDLGAWCTGLAGAIEEAATGAANPLAMTEPRTHEGSGGTFTQADLVPRAGAQHEQAAELLSGTFGSLRARARLAATPCALLFGLGEQPVGTGSASHPGFADLSSVDACDAWLRLVLTRAHAEAAPPLLASGMAAVALEGVDATSVVLETSRTGAQRCVSVEWRVQG